MIPYLLEKEGQVHCLLLSARSQQDRNFIKHRLESMRKLEVRRVQQSHTIQNLSTEKCIFNRKYATRYNTFLHSRRYPYHLRPRAEVVVQTAAAMLQVVPTVCHVNRILAINAHTDLMTKFEHHTCMNELQRFF